VVGAERGQRVRVEHARDRQLDRERAQERDCVIVGAEART
jgi:hypothetical protein